MGLDELPSEVLELILGYLGVLDRLSASSVCKQWYYASLNINVWKDAVVRLNTEKATEGLNVLMNCERRFACVAFQDCSNVLPDCSTFFLHAVEMCKVVGLQLSVLQFENCSISGSHFVQILAECQNLKHLCVMDCESLFSSETLLTEPQEINKLKLSLKNVEELDLSCNKSLTDLFFTRLVEIFTNLNSISLAKCPINCHPVVFRRFYPFPHCKPSDSILTFHFIKQFISNNATKITSLNFIKTDIDNAALKALAHIEGLQLESMYLSQCSFVTSYGVKEFCHCQKWLKKLDLPVTIILDQVLHSICVNLLQLRELSVGGYWSPENISSLRAVKTHTLCNLVKLDLNSCCEIVVLKFIDSVRNEAYPKLRHLNLHSTKVDDYVFIYMIPYLLHITYLDLGYSLITDKSLILISTHLVRLQVLKLPLCERVTDKGLIGNFGKCPAFLNYGTPGAIEDAGEVKFGNREFLKFLVFDDHSASIANLKGLKELNLYGISGISDDGIKMALVFKELRCLCIGGNSKITNEGLIAIGQNNRSLEVLELRNSVHVTEIAIAKVLTYLPRLKLLDLQGCTQFTNSSISDLVKGYSFKLKY